MIGQIINGDERREESRTWETTEGGSTKRLLPIHRRTSSNGAASMPLSRKVSPQSVSEYGKGRTGIRRRRTESGQSGNYGGAIGHVARGGVEGVAGVADDVLRSAAYVLDPAANALKTFVTGDSTPINPASAKQRFAQPQVMAQSAYSNEGRGQSAIESAISPEAAALRVGTGNAGGAQVTPSGNMQFTQKGFDPHSTAVR